MNQVEDLFKAQAGSFWETTRPDGTMRDALRMARGYWEARDSRVS